MADQKLTVRNSKKLSRAFYLRATLRVARDLLGNYLVREYRGKKLIGRIVEAEAYRERDPASHSYRGRTKRNDVMYWEGGHLYVYFTYGMHFCANVVTRRASVGEAVLIRAVEPIEGIVVMMRNRFGSHHSTNYLLRGRIRLWRKSPISLTNGPAKFCEAFGIAREQNGADLLGDQIYLLNGERIPESKVGRSARIGIKNGTEKKWRFFVKGNPWVSK